MDNNLKILVVEDEFIASEYLIHILNKLGFFDIFTVDNCRCAIELANKESVGLVFMDINLAGPMDGIQCAESINLNKEIPIIFTTAYSDENTIEEVSKTNLYGFIVKPFKERDVSICLKILEKQLFSKETSKRVTLSPNSIYDFTKESLYINDKKINLTKNETHLIKFLYEQRGKKITYDEMREIVWKKNISDSGIRDAFSRLRNKAPELNIVSHYGLGYSLELE